jgi:hypothetical protein
VLLDDVLPLHPTNVRFILSPDARVMLMNVPKEQSHLNGVVANQFNLFPARRRWHAARMSSAPPSPCIVIAHVQNDYVMATRAIRNFPVTVSRSSNRTGHARCRAQRSLHSRRLLIGRRQAACHCPVCQR